MSNLNYGLILRAYAKTEEIVSEVVKRAVANIELALSIGFHDIIILVPIDYDCGKTVDALYIKKLVNKKTYTSQGDQDITVVKH